MCRFELKVFFSFFLLIIINIPYGFGKNLKCPQADILNIAFQGLPFALARLRISHRAAITTKHLITQDQNHASSQQETKKQTNNSENSESQEEVIGDHATHQQINLEAKDTHQQEVVIKKQLLKIFKPIKDFLTEIRNNSFFIKPLIEKSLPEKILKKSYLLKFMHSSLGIIDFFEQEVSTKEKLLEICEELDTFFTDIEDSLSLETQKAYQKFIQEVKQAKHDHSEEKHETIRMLDFSQLHHDQEDTSCGLIA